MSFKSGDSISFILDLSKAEIKIILNGVDKGVLMTNIAKGDDIKYRFMVSMLDQTSSVELLRFVATDRD